MSLPAKDAELDPQLITDAILFLSTYITRFSSFSFAAIYNMFMLILYSTMRYIFPNWSWLVAWLYHGYCIWNIPDFYMLRKMLVFALLGFVSWERAIFAIVHTGVPLLAYPAVAALCYAALPFLRPSNLFNLVWEGTMAMIWLLIALTMPLYAWSISSTLQRDAIRRILNRIGQTIAHFWTPFFGAWEGFCRGRGKFLIFWWKIWERRADRIFQNHFSRDTVEKFLDGKSERKIFEYSPLQEREIRLLEISMGPTRNIEAKVIKVLIDEAKDKFDAISYTWGPSTLTHGIVIDGAWLPTTTSVYNILFHQTPIVGKARIWIDYVCINQADNEEKARQVRLMRNIYSSARQVIACISNIHDDHADVTEHYLSSVYANRNLKVPRIYRIIRQQFLVAFRVQNPKWDSMSRFLNNPYWTRVWIIQEIAAAKKLRIICGDRELSWDALCFLVSSFFKDETDPFLDTSNLSKQGENSALVSLDRMQIMMKMREVMHSAETTTLKDILPISPRFEATDKRDHVFGLQGMITEVLSNELLPDYSVEVEELLRKVAYYLLRQDDPLWLFHHSGIGRHRNYPHLPTWIPDWTGESWMSTSDSLPDSFKNELSLKNLQFWKNIKSISQWMLPIKALPIGSIVQIAQIPVVEGTKSLMKGTINRSVSSMSSDPTRWSNLRAMVRQRVADPYVTGEPRDQALWRMMLGYDGNDSNNKTALSLFDTFDRLMTFYSTRSARLDDDLSHSNGFRQRAKAMKEVALTTAEFNILSAQVTNYVTSPLGFRCSGRSVAVTKEGYMALVPSGTKVDDTIFFVLGADTPVILRDDRYWPSSPVLAKMPRYRLVGDCYVHGLSFDESLKKQEQWQDIGLF